MNQKQKIIEAGIEYIKKGFSVVPTISKHTLGKWKERQEIKLGEEEFKKMVLENSPDGLAIMTGKISGVIVIDVDSEEADIALNLPKTPTVRTSKGKHYYFKWREGVQNSVGKIREKVDVRSDGGYVIAPPSIHESGVKYEWLTDLDTEMAEFPIELLEFKNQNTDSKNKNWMKIINGVPEGQRHDSIVRIIGKFLNCTLESEWQNLIWPTVQLINKNNIPPLDDTELETAFNSIANKEQEKRNGNVQSSPKIKIISLKELMAKTDIEERYLVNDLILEGSINVISGHPGVGKTWVMLEMARSVASGNKFLDQFDTLQGAVLIIDAESGESKIKKRMTLMKVNDELPIFLASLQGIKVDDQNTSNFILGEAKRLGIKFLIFDPFSAIHSKNENSSDEMQKVMEALQEFTLNGITVLFLHHHRKESSQYPNSNAQGLRGSSLILSRVDSMSIITSKDEGQSIRIKFSQEKMRSKRKLKPFDIFLDENEFGVDMKYAGEVGTDMGKFDLALELIPEILLVEGGKTTKEILELAKEAEEIGDKTMLMAIKKLVDVKTILKTKQGKENFYTHARLLKNTEIKEESLAE